MNASGRARFTATHDKARAGICAVIARLAKHGLVGDRLGMVEIVLAEAINNIV